LSSRAARPWAIRHHRRRRMRHRDSVGFARASRTFRRRSKQAACVNISESGEEHGPRRAEIKGQAVSGLHTGAEQAKKPLFLRFLSVRCDWEAPPGSRGFSLGSVAAKPNYCEHAIWMKQRLVNGFDDLAHTRDQKQHMPSSMTATGQGRDGWADLFFLKNALERGMTCGDVAGFLSRGEAEACTKAMQMKINYRRLGLYCHYRVRRGA
jgi:hypothetical protein